MSVITVDSETLNALLTLAGFNYFLAGIGRELLAIKVNA